MRVAICEDRDADVRLLQGILEQYLSRNHLAAEIDRFPSGERFLEQFEPGKYQIIFMDIYMDEDGLTGMQAAERVHQADKDAAIIFTTTSEVHGIAGYKVAEYYILKPVSEEELACAMEKCESQIRCFAATIEVISERRAVSVRLRDILYAEVQRHNCILHTKEGDIRVSMAFDQLSHQLGGLPFLRCHRSFAINLSHAVDMRGYDIILASGAKIPIGRMYQSKVMKIVDEWIKAEVRQNDRI